MNIETQYLDLLADILKNGIKKEDRTGTGTISVFGRQIRHKMKNGFPLLTTKKMYFKGIITELIWFLRGDTNIKYLLENDCHIWDGDAYKKYSDYTNKVIEAYKELSLMGSQSEFDKLFKTKSSLDPLSKEEFIEKIKSDIDFCKQWGDLGPIYGKQWRSWDIISKQYGEYIDNTIDQITNLIHDLENNPDSRRLMVSAWNVGEIDNMTLPPCHYGFQLYTRELTKSERSEWYESKFGRLHFIPPSDILMDEMNVPKRAISLMWSQRSVDVPLGLPFNIASYGLLLEILGKLVNMVPDELIGNLGDCHIYKNQIDGINEQIQREPFTLPSLNVSPTVDFKKDVTSFLKSCNISDFVLENYKCHPSIKIPLSN